MSEAHDNTLFVQAFFDYDTEGEADGATFALNSNTGISLTNPWVTVTPAAGTVGISTSMISVTASGTSDMIHQCLNEMSSTTFGKVIYTNPTYTSAGGFA